MHLINKHEVMADDKRVMWDTVESRFSYLLGNDKIHEHRNDERRSPFFM